MEKRNAGATVTPVKSDIAALVIVAALHLVIGGAHQYAHAVAGVENSPLQVLFIVLVVTITPWVAIGLTWKWNQTIGGALFSVSMAASLVFGIVLHFAVESPDLYSNVVPEHSMLFGLSALSLALVEFIGLVVGAHAATRRWHTA